jgi:MFS family permease
MIISFTDSLAASFKEQKWMSVLTSSLVIFGMIIRIINAMFIIQIKHRIKNLFVLGSYFMGIILLILSKSLDLFGLCVFGIIFIGGGSALGDSVNLGFLKAFPPVLLGSYCGGVGFSACLGSVIFLVLKIKEIDFIVIFICMLIIYPSYYIVFVIIIRLKTQIDASNKKLVENFEEKTDPESPVESEEKERNKLSDLVGKLSEINPLENKEASINEPLGKETLLRILRKIWIFPVINISVYIFEFLTISAILSRISLNLKTTMDPFAPTWYLKYSFELLMVIYQFMVLIFRSSLMCFQIKNIYIYIIPVYFFGTFLFIQSLFTSVFPFWVIVINIIFLGSFAGISYCNLNNRVLNHFKLEKSEKVCLICRKLQLECIHFQEILESFCPDYWVFY